ncbi:uncharacterized protein LY79DRAFT_35103 [Colletotrichum navitas]|uniref:Secreted protein n=1 Tax=Colletotrichum navitas TaxID=681940 RepID=A0AAD8Q7Y0_9PEZI|nr:uncharacterized protein LY79DRAFT_35103 [Colletotrichum navitas]KAK1596891.1 hypothetical protein LY79DRAFT_35103 [Colletotrichum navitas]
MHQGGKGVFGPCFICFLIIHPSICVSTKSMSKPMNPLGKDMVLTTDFFFLLTKGQTVLHSALFLPGLDRLWAYLLRPHTLWRGGRSTLFFSPIPHSTSSRARIISGSEGRERPSTCCHFIFRYQTVTVYSIGTPRGHWPRGRGGCTNQIEEQILHEENNRRG